MIFYSIIDIIIWKDEGMCNYVECLGHYRKRWLWRQFKMTRGREYKGKH